MLNRMIKVGRFRLIDHKGRAYDAGDGTGPQLTVRLHGASTAAFLASRPELALGECYMHARLTFEDGVLAALPELGGPTHKPKTKRSLIERMRYAVQRQLM